MKRWSRWVVLAVVLFALSATAFGQMRPRKFCGCPDHPQPRDGVSVTAPGTRYRLHAYDDAFRPSLADPWCYTRMLDSSTNIALYAAEGDEFKPAVSERIKRLFSFLTGFATVPGSLSPSPTRITVRVTSTVLGNAPPYTLEYQIDSPTKHSLDLRQFGRRPSSGERLLRLYWEAAVSQEFYDEAEHGGVVDGGAGVSIKLKSIPTVGFGIGRLVILPPGVQPPAPGVSARGALLLGTASAFRIVPGGQPLPPGPVEIR